jgi:hypothetical protein
MNAIVSALYRDVTCAAMALLITVMLGAAFVESTAAVPGTRTESGHALALQATHGWFGQPEPAVLVD